MTAGADADEMRGWLSQPFRMMQLGPPRRGPARAR